MDILKYNTVTPTLKNILLELMNEPLFKPFVLVGGTALSLKYGHRISIDIDLFTDTEYGSLDYLKLESYLKKKYPYYIDHDKTGIIGFGKSYMIGYDPVNSIKLDLFYTDPFIRPIETLDDIRIASTEDLIAMKMDVISRSGRKKDFWDLHKLLEDFDIKTMIALHAERYPWTHEKDKIIEKLIDFSLADSEPDPNCLEEKLWSYIQDDFTDIYCELNT